MYSALNHERGFQKARSVQLLLAHSSMVHPKSPFIVLRRIMHHNQRILGYFLACTPYKIVRAPVPALGPDPASLKYESISRQ